jgi:tetratricopeptide (TPR) repeat protein
MSEQDTGRSSFLQQAETALRSGNLNRALELARAGLAFGEGAPLLFALRAHWHERSGRFPQACADLDRALQDTPSDASLLVSLARCLGHAGEFERAADAARAALAIAPTSDEANFHFGFAREMLGELDESRRAYEKVNTSHALFGEAQPRLAALAARRGDWNGARAHAAANPAHPTARLARVMADLGEGNFTSAEKGARAIAATAKEQPQIRASALSFLGDALHGQSRSPQAFAAYSEANAIQREFSAVQFEGEGKETSLAMARRLAAEFETATPPWPVTPAEGDGRKHVFVLGFARSGTTLLSEILAGHPDVGVVDEKPFLSEAIVAFAGAPGGVRRIAEATPEQLAEWRNLYWQRVAAAEVKGDLIVDKAPFNTLHLPLLARLFPRAKIVFAARDPRDVVFACFRRHFALTTYTYEFLSLDRAGAFYDATMRLAGLYRTRLPLSVLEVRNEDVAAGPQAQVERLCAFLGLSIAPAMTDFLNRDRRRAIASPAAVDLASGIRANQPGWRDYASELAPVLPVLAPWVTRFGYAAMAGAEAASDASGSGP